MIQQRTHEHEKKHDRKRLPRSTCDKVETSAASNRNHEETIQKKHVETQEHTAKQEPYHETRVEKKQEDHLERHEVCKNKPNH